MAGNSDSSVMAKGRVINRSVSKTRPIDMTLNLECSEEPLSEAQLAMRTKLKENYDRVASTLEEIIKEHSGQLITQVGGVSAYQYKLPGPGNPQTILKTNQLNVVNQNKSIKLNVVDNSNSGATTTAATTQGNMQLVVDPRMGVLLGTVVSSQSSSNSAVTTTLTAAAAGTAATTLSSVSQKSLTSTSENSNNLNRTPVGTGSVSTTNTTTSTTPTQMRRAKVIPLQQLQEEQETPAPVLRLRNKAVTTAATTTTATPSLNSHVTKSKMTTSGSITVVRPTEQTSIGGIRVGVKNAASDSIDEAKKNLPDGKEIAFNKINGTRTFPSLVVIARPHLSTKKITTTTATQERSELDITVKSVLVYLPSKFAEWLIQKGLIRSEQFCNRHTSGVVAASGNSNCKKLKLGMYSDAGTFPYSGGYVWIANCCSNRFVSVFSGSIFQGAPHPPSVLLKLIYHWACQTNVQNVVSWVKVSNVYVKNFYTNLRSVCTAAIWDKSSLMGGKNINIQVGVISLGTTSQDGNMRQVKVEVLGILDAETGQLRLRACDPIHDADRSFKRRFNNILHPLQDWVHKESKILTDFTVDKSTLQEMGFSQVYQTSFSDQNPRNTRSNYQIMEYLRKIVPRMFQNTLSLLSRQMIQQFLDELVWREMFGSTAARAFNNIIQHLAEQTRLCTAESLLDRLAKISANPFTDWSYSGNAAPAPSVAAPCDSFKGGLTSNHKKENNSRTQPAVNDLPVQLKPGPKRKRKRQPPAASAADLGPESKRPNLDYKIIQSKGIESLKNDQIPLSEFYYATVDGNPLLVAKEDKHAINFKCFLCKSILKSNTQVMEHMISHVPPRAPGQFVTSNDTSTDNDNDDNSVNNNKNQSNRNNYSVCRYCCAAFSSKHQMTTHIDEAHSVFGKSDDGVMVVCGICEQKFANTQLLINHMSCMHLPSEMPYRCESCRYRTSSHKDIIDHYYDVHDMGDSLQCPYCLKLMRLNVDGKTNTCNVYAYLVHLQRHVVRREQGRGNKCSRCCLWFNQKSLLKRHQRSLHQSYYCPKDSSNFHPFKHPPSDSDKSNIIIISKSQHQLKRIIVRSPSPELPEDDNIRKWVNGPIKLNLYNQVPARAITPMSCKECEEDIDEEEHFPGEQNCLQCRYVTCCWRAFKEHQQQIHNERPMTSLIVPSPLIDIPLDKKMTCSCGYATLDGNLLATHLVKCRKSSPQSTVTTVPETAEANKESPVMLDSLGLIPKSTP